MLSRSTKEQVAVAYFYCDYRDTAIQTTEYILASLIRQLTAFCAIRTKPIPDALHQAYKERNEANSTFRALSNLETVFIEICKEFKSTYVVIDALDESDGNIRLNDGQTARGTLLKMIHRISQYAKIFLTSRPHPVDIRRSLACDPHIAVEATEADITLFLDKMMTTNEEFMEIIGNDRIIREVVIHALVNKAQGM
jgi:hypothetical protein